MPLWYKTRFSMTRLEINEHSHDKRDSNVVLLVVCHTRMRSHPLCLLSEGVKVRFTSSLSVYAKVLAHNLNDIRY